eukprot:386336_1
MVKLFRKCLFAAGYDVRYGCMKWSTRNYLFQPYAYSSKIGKFRYTSSTINHDRILPPKTDMNEQMQLEATIIATEAISKQSKNEDIAKYIKQEFDKKYNPIWQCIVGKNFGSFVTYEKKK